MNSVFVLCDKLTKKTAATASRGRPSLCFMFAAVALNADDQPLLAVLFHWDGCWQYTIHAPSELSEIHLYADE